jgi:hypothetical protein
MLRTARGQRPEWGTVSLAAKKRANIFLSTPKRSIVDSFRCTELFSDDYEFGPSLPMRGKPITNRVWQFRRWPAMVAG